MEAVVEGDAEARFLLFERRGDQRLGAEQLGVGRAHLGDEGWHEAVHQRVGAAEQMSVAHRPAHDPAQDIAAPFVRR